VARVVLSWVLVSRLTQPSLALFAAFQLTACAARDPRFPLRPPLLRDSDLAPVYARCHVEPTRAHPHHVACAPEVFDASLYWDGADNLIFRRLSKTFGAVTSGEAVDVNSLDEVPDSSWFQTRIDSVTDDELARGACEPGQLLDPDAAPDGSWVIDKGKMEGSTPGFRMLVPGKGHYMVKLESVDDQPERQSAGAVVGASIFHAVGYNTACEQVLYVRPSVFRLLPGLQSRRNFEEAQPFDQRALDRLFATSPRRDGRIRLSASAWLPGHPIGPFRWEGTRDDDPNDVVPHEDRRELRGMRVLAAWVGRTDTREANSFDTWMSVDPRAPDSSPGHVVHYQLDMSESFGGDWPWAPDSIARRLGYSYLIDWRDAATDFASLGAVVRPWEKLRLVPGHEIFGYYQLDAFDPDGWRNEYPNPAYERMTERDAAWMARILSRFSPEMVHTLAVDGRFTDPWNTAYLAQVLEGRLERILERYLTRLSPIAEVRVEARERLCGVDLAERRGLRPASRFRYTARMAGSRLPVTRGDRGGVCVALRHVAPDGGPADDAAARYVRVVVADGVARGPLVADLYDLGPRRGFVLAGLERPEPP
jgi:hypothetical protein